MNRFYLLLVVFVVVSVGLYALLVLQTDVDWTVARYIAGAVFLIPTAIAGHHYVPPANRMTLWAVLLGSVLALVIRG